MEERRSGARRDTDKSWRDQIEEFRDQTEDELRALRFIVTGHRDAPASGLVRQYGNLEGKVTWMIRTNIAAVIAVCGAIVGKAF
jgi:hypothetical protein